MDIKNQFLAFEIRFAKIFVKHFMAIVLITILVIAGGAFYFILLPKYELYNLQSKTELPRLQSILKSETEKLDKLKNTKIEYTKSEESEQVKKMLKIIPSEREISNLFIMFDAMSKESLFKLANLSISEDLSSSIDRDLELSISAPVKVHRLRISMSMVGGGYESLKKFLRIIETSLRIMDINSLTFSPNAKGETGYYVMLTTYYIED